jgi:hypothetical protein
MSVIVIAFPQTRPDFCIIFSARPTSLSVTITTTRLLLHEDIRFLRDTLLKDLIQKDFPLITMAGVIIVPTLAGGRMTPIVLAAKRIDGALVMDGMNTLRPLRGRKGGRRHRVIDGAATLPRCLSHQIRGNKTIEKKILPLHREYGFFLA